VKQKFVIRKNNKNGLELQEYSELEKDQFFLVYQCVYDNSEIEPAIEKGNKEIIETLRNDSFFPYQNYIEQIAETVKEIYTSNIENSVEVSFDDQEYNLEDAEDIELSDEIEKLLEDDDILLTDVTTVDNEGVVKIDTPQED
jgi:ATP-dependent protease HslVU (ClpYQ) ATPase subunit